MAVFEFDTRLWRHTGSDAWHFVTLPEDAADVLRELAAGVHRPFGSLPVHATIGATSWSTSLFSDTKRGSYLLPVKAHVRRSEGLAEGAHVQVRISLAL